MEYNIKKPYKELPISYLLEKILEQMKIANELKAFELKEKNPDLIYQIAKIMYN